MRTNYSLMPDDFSCGSCGAVYSMVGLGWFLLFNATFNNISVISLRSILLVEETGELGENHRPAGRHR